MKKHCLTQLSIFLVILLFSTSNLVAQERDCNYKKPHQADTWIFGEKARMIFTQDPPVINPTLLDFHTPSGSASISDNNGNLLFFTNGKTVWNKSYHVMQNGEGLAGALLGGQTSIIVPHPGNDKQYFIFTSNMYLLNFLEEGVNYSTVDFTNNDKGEVTAKNNFLFRENSKTLCAVKHENGTDYWVVFHGFGPNKGNKFYSYLVNADGVATTAIESVVGYNQDGDLNNQVGYMKASSNGEKIAITLPTDGVVEILNFDNSTGKLSNPITSSAGEYYMPFGIEFSPDNSKLYLTTSPLVAGNKSFLYQLDVANSQPFATQTIIKEIDYNGLATDYTLQGIQLGVDGKVYVTKTYQSGISMPNLGVVYNPDRNGIACNYNILEGAANNGQSLNGAGTQGGLPDFVSTFLDIPHFFYLNQCLNDTTKIEIRNKANVTPTWDFKDPTGTSDLSDPMKPKFVFSADGTYKVELTESYEGNDYVFTEDILINPLPEIEIGNGSNIIYILPNSSIRLDAGEGFDVYKWQPDGSTGQFLNVNAEGQYIATVTDFNCCTNSDTVEVRIAKLAYPTAIKPSSSKPINQTFKVTGDVSGIAKYQLNIFNRWGQLIYESDDPTVGWDGTYEGADVPVGTYVYSSVFTSFESDIQSSIDIKKTGTVTVIR